MDPPGKGGVPAGSTEIIRMKYCKGTPPPPPPPGPPTVNTTKTFYESRIHFRQANSRCFQSNSAFNVFTTLNAVIISGLSLQPDICSILTCRKSYILFIIIIILIILFHQPDARVGILIFIMISFININHL